MRKMSKKDIVMVFYRDSDGKLKHVTTTDERETIKYLKSEGYRIVGEIK